MKLMSGQDLSWQGLAGALALMFLVSSALRGPLPDGDRLPVLLEYLGGFLAAAIMGGVIVLAIWAFKRFFQSQAYAAPRRDYAIAVLLMAAVTFRPV
jgi:hypothetical protein